MDKLKMHSKDKTQENYEILQKLFPNAVTETITGYDEDGKAIVERAIDKDVLQQEINAAVVEGKDERYQFTWPDKKRAIVSANAPINKTLRPCREESVDFDNTENLYIEGDNLEVLKLLQETYLGKIKMIYIDPPYNTGHDFVYNDKFSVSADEWDEMSGELDEYGNRLTQNTESNGRFHTDWLNMIYPRLKIARDLLTDDGVIFISIDDNEVENLTKVCKEIFGEDNYINALKWKRKKQPSFLSKHIAPVMEYVLIVAKNSSALGKFSIDKVSDSTKKVMNISNPEAERVFKAGVEVKGMESGVVPKGVYTVKTMTVEYLDDIIVEKGRTVNAVRVVAKFLNTQEKIDEFVDKGLLFITAAKGLRRYVSPEESDKEKSISDLLLDWGDNQDSEKEQKDLLKEKYFDYTKPVKLLYNLTKSNTSEDDIIMDFFSGSATTAHAVVQLNSGDGGNRKFIMVQLPEKTDEKSEAYKAGYQNICEIGKERIRRAGSRIKEELRLAAPIEKAQNGKGSAAVLIDEAAEKYGEEVANRLDIGFRVLKLDSSNMKDVYYNPADFSKNLLDTTIDNIKEDRTPEDLLFQVMLDLGVLLSSKIEETEIAGKKVFNVADGFLIACFDNDVNEEVITAVAKQQPIYFVMRDSSLSTDTTATNFDQIFETYSPDTVRKVI